jgi:hypothetical protein
MSKPDLSTYGGFLYDAGYSGQLVDMNPTTTVSRINEAAQIIDFGYAVVRGAASDTCKAPAADTDKVIGISIRHATMVADTSGNVSYARYYSVPILEAGRIYAVAAENVTLGDTAVSITAQFGKLGGSTGNVAGTATSAAKSGGNTGTGTLVVDGTTPVLANAIAGVYTARCTVAGTNSATFEVRDPKNDQIGTVAFSGSGASATFANQIKFAVTDSGTDFVVGDGFDITVVLNAGRVQLDGTSGNVKATWETTTAAGAVGVVYVR